MEALKILSSLKFKSFHLAIQFLITISLPGILILFYFYRPLFDSYDYFRLLMLQTAISFCLLVCSYSLCSCILFLFEMKHSKDAAIMSEDDSLESLFSISSLFSLIIFLALFLIYFLIGSRNIHSFILWFIGVEILYSILTYHGLNIIFKELKEKYQQEAERAKEIEKNKELKRTQLKDDILKYKNSLKLLELKLDKAGEFQFLRTPKEKSTQITIITNKINWTKDTLKGLETELRELDA